MKLFEFKLFECAELCFNASAHIQDIDFRRRMCEHRHETAWTPSRADRHTIQHRIFILKHKLLVVRVEKFFYFVRAAVGDIDQRA